MRLLIFITLLTIICLIGKYYTKILTRLEKLTIKKKNKAIVFIETFLAYTLAFCTINFFSSLGIFLVHFLFFSLIAELINWLIKKQKFKTWHTIYQASLLPLIFTGLFFTYGYINIRSVVSTNYELTSSKDVSLNILFISDSHYGTVLNKNSLDKIIKEISSKEFDLVLLGGDIVDENTTKEQMMEIFAAIGKINTTYGSYFIYGNHDRQRYTTTKSYTEEELVENIQKNNIEILKDTKKDITENITLVGREDRSLNRASIEELIKETDNQKYTIMVDHQPVDYEKSSQLGVDLLLSGHTHAGQIFPAGYFIKWFHMSDLYYGHTKIKNMDAIVSSGLAGWGYPIRTQQHSEYVTIKIAKKRV